LSENNIISLPESIGELKNLNILNLSNNELESLPREYISRLKKLRTLVVSGNPDLRYIDERIKRNGLTISKNQNTKFVNYSYFRNQLSVITVKRPNLPNLPQNIRREIVKKINVNEFPEPRNQQNATNINNSIKRGKYRR